jgi:phosphoheptose isomerase
MSTTQAPTDTLAVAQRHLGALSATLEALADESPRLAEWGGVLADRLLDGGRLLAGGNGGSAAEAQHLTAEFVGRFDGDRRAFSAINLSSETSALTAISNDYGYAESFARQVTAHGRPGDVLVLLSTSGTSANLVRGAEAGRAAGLTVWAMTGPGPNPLTAAVDDALTLPGVGANVQEAQLVAVHVLCRVFDALVLERLGATR